MLSSKKGFIMSPGDFIKGMLIGFIIGALTIFLVAKNIIPLPFL